MAALDHFRQRVAERCPAGTDADQLANEISRAIRKEQHDVIERVMPARSKDGLIKRTIWRIRVAEQSIYVVVCDKSARPITVLSQEQIAVTKAARKARRKRQEFEAMRAEEESNRHARARAIRLRKNGGIRR
ncbi:hypothetical protein [Paracoccus sp. 22332]|uniref:hypothetical protein n=1 Tax=Paracoccus sp. 22332 TaxID=3453913 RepID=UPI003F8283EB